MIETAFTKIREELSFLRESGQKEYAHKVDDAFGNFRRIADLMGISMERVLLVYALKHMDGIIAWYEGHKSQRENVSGRINDLIVYLVLLYAMQVTAYKSSRKDVANLLDDLLDEAEAYIASYSRPEHHLSPFQEVNISMQKFARGNIDPSSIRDTIAEALALRLEVMDDE
ncbi:MAG: hypothetical protein MJH10_10910 [Epibacterium sp.]|nr:hypothetical protein [Epibacterium sp.]NQX74055.1 hypothetical protein [Epibacterium sp.]